MKIIVFNYLERITREEEERLIRIKKEEAEKERIRILSEKHEADRLHKIKGFKDCLKCQIKIKTNKQFSRHLE